MASITKRDIVIEVSNQTGLEQRKVAEVLETALDFMSKELSQTNTVTIRQFGSFQLVPFKSKVGRDPKNPERVYKIPARAVVKFKPSKELKEKVAPALPLLLEQQK